MNHILKGEWGFDGFIESDWTAVAEMRACPPVNPDTGECGHGVAADGPAAAALALNSGVDSEMTSTLIRDFGAQLLAEHRISMRRIDDAVRRILRIKFRAGLFENPYAPFAPAPGRGADAAARRRRGGPRGGRPLDGAAQERGRVLPLDPAKKTAVIGPLANNQHDMLGPWWGAGRDEDAVTVFDGIDDAEPRRDLRARAASSRTPSRRPTTRRAARPTPASPRRSPPRRRPTRSCSRSARRAR